MALPVTGNNIQQKPRMADERRNEHIVRRDTHANGSRIISAVMRAWVVGAIVWAAMGSRLGNTGRLMMTARPAVPAGMVGCGMVTAAMAALRTSTFSPAVGPGIATDEKNHCTCCYHPFDRSFFHDSPLAFDVPRPMMSDHCGTVWFV